MTCCPNWTAQRRNCQSFNSHTHPHGTAWRGESDVSPSPRRKTHAYRHDRVLVAEVRAALPASIVAGWDWMMTPTASSMSGC